MSERHAHDQNRNIQHQDWMAEYGDELREIIARMRAVGVAELELQQGENRLRLRRGNPVEGIDEEQGEQDPVEIALPRAAPPTQQLPQPPRTPLTLPPSPVLMTSDQHEWEEHHTPITSPLVGTFYMTSAPNKPPLVAEGMTIKVGQPVGVIEAMKMFNEIQSDVAGVVLAILVENGQPVEYGQPLIVVDTTSAE